MNIIICGIYSGAEFISLDVALWGGIYSTVAFISLNVALWGGVYSRAAFISLDVALWGGVYFTRYGFVERRLFGGST